VNEDGGKFPQIKSRWLISVAELISSVIVAELSVHTILEPQMLMHG
jgi:hypothetical protein